MEMEISLPTAIPVMTLPDTVFFPQALLPLHIFEPRYQQMLRDVLVTHRIFAVAHLNHTLAAAGGHFEPSCRVATAGIIRACQKHGDGTADLLLQGLCRVDCAEIVHEDPYRFMLIRPLASTPGAGDTESRRMRDEAARLLQLKRKLDHAMPGEMADFLQTVEDPETFVDLAAFGLCADAAVKQTLLETLDTCRRLELFNAQIRADIATLRLSRRLQGALGDDAIPNN